MYSIMTFQLPVRSETWPPGPRGLTASPYYAAELEDPEMTAAMENPPSQSFSYCGVLIQSTVDEMDYIPIDLFGEESDDEREDDDDDYDDVEDDDGTDLITLPPPVVQHIQLGRPPWLSRPIWMWMGDTVSQLFFETPPR
jgi:hypothetical protein